MSKLIIFICVIQNFVLSQNIELKSIQGVWNYEYSYNEDTCLNLTKENQFNGENQMSRKYSFPYLNETISKGFETKFLINYKWENAFCIISSFQNNNKTNNLSVIYYSDSTTSFKYHWFIILKLEGELIHICDERMYTYSEDKIGNFCHVYRRKFGLPPWLHSFRKT